MESQQNPYQAIKKENLCIRADTEILADRVGFEPTCPCGQPHFESLESAIPACPTVAFVSTWKHLKSLILCGFDGAKPMASGLLKKPAALQVFRKSVSRL